MIYLKKRSLAHLMIFKSSDDKIVEMVNVFETNLDGIAVNFKWKVKE